MNDRHYHNLSYSMESQFVNGGKIPSNESSVQNKSHKTQANPHPRQPVMHTTTKTPVTARKHIFNESKKNTKKIRRCWTFGYITVVFGACIVIIGIIILSIGQAKPPVFSSSNVSIIAGPVLIVSGVLIIAISFKFFYDACQRENVEKDKYKVPIQHIRTVSGQIRNHVIPFTGNHGVPPETHKAVVRPLDLDVIHAKEISSNNPQQRRYVVSTLKPTTQNRIQQNRAVSGRYSHQKRLAASSHRTSRKSQDHPDFALSLELSHSQLHVNGYLGSVIDKQEIPARRRSSRIDTRRSRKYSNSKNSAASSKLSTISTPMYMNHMMFPRNGSKYGVSSPEPVFQQSPLQENNKISAQNRILSAEFLESYQGLTVMSDNTSSQVSLFVFDEDAHSIVPETTPHLEKCVSLQDILHEKEYSPTIKPSQRVFSLDNGQTPFFSHQIERQYHKAQTVSDSQTLMACRQERQLSNKASFPNVSYQTEV